MKPKEDPLAFLLQLNGELADREASMMKPVVGPGLPSVVSDPAPFISTDCVNAKSPQSFPD